MPFVVFTSLNKNLAYLAQYYGALTLLLQRYISSYIDARVSNTMVSMPLFFVTVFCFSCSCSLLSEHSNSLRLLTKQGSISTRDILLSFLHLRDPLSKVKYSNTLELSKEIEEQKITEFQLSVIFKNTLVLSLDHLSCSQWERRCETGSHELLCFVSLSVGLLVSHPAY